MLIAILSLLDIFSALFLLFFKNLYILHGLIGFMAVYSLLKGFFSFLSSVGMRYYFDWMGIVDVLVGISLFLTMWGFPSVFFQTIGVIALLKGIYSILRAVFKI